MAYIIQEGTLLESFNVLGDWTQGGTAGGTMSIDSLIVPTGCLKLTAPAPSGNQYATKTINVDMSRAGVVTIEVYLDPDYITYNSQNVQDFVLYLSTTADFSKFFSKSINGLVAGWNKIQISKNQFSNTGSAAWTDAVIRMRVRMDVSASATDTGTVYFKSVSYGGYSRPIVIWSCDDGADTQYTELYQYMKRYKMKACCSVYAAAVGTGGYMTLAQLTELYNAGWDIGNHTYNHINLTTLSQANAENQLSLMSDFLAENGFTRNNMHLMGAYPNGGYNKTVTDAAQNVGMLLMRTVIGQSGVYTDASGVNPLRLVTRNLVYSETLQQALDKIDNAIACGGTIILESHRFVETPDVTTEYQISYMQSLVDYIAHLRDGGVIDVMTYSEWYRGLSESRKIA